MSITTEITCPHCGKPVPATALQGICPECMLKAGLTDTGEFGPEGASTDKSAKPPPPRAEDIAPHFPQLEILECLGRGGMGAVYKARQPKLDRFVALKILTHSRPPGISDTEFAARFQQEARALARLSHPDIVAVYDYGEAGGYHYLLMEYVEGLTLRQLLQTGKLPPEQALAIVPKICEALQFAHERGIVHRDIKPENILLDKLGRVKIADFGIAKILGTAATGAGLTGAKDVIGTPHYMAPEQIEKPATVDHRADIFSLGVVFYEMLTGELPLGKFALPSHKVQVDVRLDEVVLHALEKEPERRYQHASEVKTDVERITQSGPSASGGASEDTVSATTSAGTVLRPKAIVSVGGAILASAVLFSILAGATVLGWFDSDRSFSLPAALGAVATVTVVAVSFGVWLVSSATRSFFRPPSPCQPASRPTGPKERTGFQPIFAALMLLVSFGAWVLFGYWTYIQPILVERVIAQASPVSAGQRLMFQLGGFVHTYYWFFVPLFVLMTVGSFIWLILSAIRPRKSLWIKEGLQRAGLSITRKSTPKEAPKPPPGTKLVSGARWTARVFGTLLLAFYAFFILAEGLPPIASQPEGVQLNFVALGLMLAGFVAGWKREGTAALLIACGWTLWQISENSIRWNLFQTPLPVAMLYGFCWWATRGRRSGVLMGTVVVLVVLLGLGRWFLPTSVFVRGTVVDAQTHQPVPNVEMRLLPRPPGSLEKGDPPNARGNAVGAFNLYVGWYAEAKAVEISAPGYGKLTTNLGPRALGARQVSRNLQLHPANVASAIVASQVPPVVIETVPPSGATDVDPAITELRVSFSKPMRDGSWSWTVWSEKNFPEMTGQPRYLADGRTCVLPVKLKPGKLYATWLNSELHQDFKDQENRPAVPYLLIFETRK